MDITLTLNFLPIAIPSSLEEEEKFFTLAPLRAHRYSIYEDTSGGRLLASRTNLA